MNTNAIPSKAVPYILYQRTSYITLTHTLLYRALRRVSPVSLYKPTVYLESLLHGNKIKQLYLQDMEREYETIKKYLPSECSSILDIGCGLAGIDIFLGKHFSGRPVDFYLLDKSKIENEVYYLFKESGAFYNSLQLAEQILLESGIEKEKIHLVEATVNNDINITKQVDLIISLISWGFHYPVHTYLEKAYEKLSPSGTLILDVRKDTSGLDEVKAKFAYVEKIAETSTKIRILAKKS